jgi:hypothetical protein
MITRKPQLLKVFVPYSAEEVTTRLMAEPECPSIVDPRAPAARALVAEGALCLIPAIGGCFAVSGRQAGLGLINSSMQVELKKTA